MWSKVSYLWTQHICIHLGGQRQCGVKFLVYGHNTFIHLGEDRETMWNKVSCLWTQRICIHLGGQRQCGVKFLVYGHNTLIHMGGEIIWSKVSWLGAKHQH